MRGRDETQNPSLELLKEGEGMAAGENAATPVRGGGCEVLFIDFLFAS